MAICSFFYHVFDNLVWCNNVGVIGEYFVGEIKLKNTKNLFSLMRNVIKLVMDFYKFKSLYLINRKNEEEVYEAFEKRVENFKAEIHNRMLTQTLEVRVKLRMKVLDIVHSFLRISMLLYSLRLEPFYSNLHPIFTGLCGMAHSIIALYKVLLEDSGDQVKGFTSTLKIEKNMSSNKKKKQSLEFIIREEEEDVKVKILDEAYFNNYYVDFNKDYPTEPKKVIYFNN